MMGLDRLINVLKNVYNEGSVIALETALGKKIAAIDLGEDRLQFTFTDKTKIEISDDGQCCCKDRYMRSDDDLDAFIGARFIMAEIREGPEIEDDRCAVHEVQFLIVTTDRGAFTVASHNEHNGYYGGFVICVKAVDVGKGGDNAQNLE